MSATLFPRLASSNWYRLVPDMEPFRHAADLPPIDGPLQLSLLHNAWTSHILSADYRPESEASSTIYADPCCAFIIPLQCDICWPTSPHLYIKPVPSEYTYVKHLALGLVRRRQGIHILQVFVYTLYPVNILMYSILC